MNKQHLFFSLALVIFAGYLGFTNCGTTSIMQNNDPGKQDQAFDPRSALEVPLDIKNRRESLDPASAEEQAGGDSGQIATLITQIETGHNHTRIVDFMGKVRCFGYNGSGQLGLGDIETGAMKAGKWAATCPWWIWAQA
ncbi:MAG: RCC1 domain-containing protein [Bdellovibrionota bacterium]